LRTGWNIKSGGQRSGILFFFVMGMMVFSMFSMVGMSFLSSTVKGKNAQEIFAFAVSFSAEGRGHKDYEDNLKVLQSVSYFLGGKKCQKIVNIGVMRKDRAAQQILFSGTILRGLTQPLNAYGYKYFSYVVCYCFTH
jgi:hypothetical protein